MQLQPDEPNSPTPYERIGGDAKVRELVERFYDLMDYEKKYAQLRAVHGTSLVSRCHLPFAIGTVERDPWMACMAQAMEETDVPQELRQPLVDAFFKTADWMRNRPG
jgi:hemoglobin